MMAPYSAISADEKKAKTKKQKMMMMILVLEGKRLSPRGLATGTGTMYRDFSLWNLNE
jgi:hypothetical protein